MRFLAATLCVLASVLLIGGSLFMNWSFWSGQGVDSETGRILGAVSIGVALLKAALPPLIAWAWLQGRIVGTVAGGFVLVLCVAFSLAGALGFASATRGHAAAMREAAADRHAALVRQQSHLGERLQQLKAGRFPNLILEELTKSRLDRRWRSSSECLEVTTDTSRTFCREYSKLKSELMAANEAQLVRQQLEKIEDALSALKATGVLQGSDLQAELIAKLTGDDQKQVSLALVSLFSVVVELGASFGLFFASLAGVKREPTRANSQQIVPTALIAAKYQIEHRPTRFVRHESGRLMIE